MGHLRYLTLTGAGEATCLERLGALAKQFPFLEWGVLYSPERAGREHRYPSLAWLEAFALRANEEGWNIALHLCGKAVHLVRDAAAAGARQQGDAARLFSLAEKFGRVQLNVRAKSSDLLAYRMLVSNLHRNEMRTRVILQWNDANKEMCGLLRTEYGFEVLVDSSGGRGVSPSSWPTAEDVGVQHIGWAGGLGPSNISEQLDIISQAAKSRPFWVDMEGKLRDAQDQFCLALCEQVAQATSRFLLEKARRSASVFAGSPRLVSELEGLWLDWWVGHLRGLPVVVPSVDARKATFLCAHEGEYRTYCPSESPTDAVEVLSQERISLYPEQDGGWTAKAVDGEHPPMRGPDMLLTGLRAVVAKHRGRAVPSNPYPESSGD
jgi:hypothetical protein